METLDLNIRHFIYQHFVKHARPPAIAEVASAQHLSTGQVKDIFQRLHDNHALFLEPGTTRIRFANPFSAVPTGFLVHTRGQSYWATCAWDMLGIPATLHSKTARIETACADCQERVSITIVKGEIVHRGEWVHFAIPFQNWYEDLIAT